MFLKANFHMHTADDPEDGIPYTFFDAVDRAQALGFGALAVTCHNTFVDRRDYRDYAAERGILMVPGIECTIEGAHIVVVNPEKGIEAVKTFGELGKYKKAHPEIFVLAPHPYFPDSYVLGGKLEKNIALFDAIERSWCYSKRVDFNRKAETIARQHQLPYLATSDTHDIRFLDTSYAMVKTEAATVGALLDALRAGHFENHTSPRKLWRELAGFVVSQHMRNAAKKRAIRRSFARARDHSL